MLDLKPREESGSRRPVVRYNLKDLMIPGKSENSFFFLFILIAAYQQAWTDEEDGWKEVMNQQPKAPVVSSVDTRIFDWMCSRLKGAFPCSLNCKIHACMRGL